MDYWAVLNSNIALIVCTSYFIQLYPVLQKKWQKKQEELRCIYGNSRSATLPSIREAHELNYALLIQKFKKKLVIHRIQEQFVFIDAKHQMIKTIIERVYKKSERKIFGGFVRDYVKNNESFYFLDFNDFDVKCKTIRLQDNLIRKLMKSFDIVKDEERIFKRQNQETITVRTIHIKNRFYSNLIMDMDIVVDSKSFTERWNRNHLINKSPDFDVNQLYLIKTGANSFQVESMIPSLSVDEIRKNIHANSFIVFSDQGILSTKHVVYSDNSSHWYEIPITWYPEYSNMDCTFRREVRITDKYPESILCRGKKIQDRIGTMKKRGWTCLTCESSCSNPCCIFSTDSDYENYLSYREKQYEISHELYRERLRKVRIAAMRELKRQQQQTIIRIAQRELHKIQASINLLQKTKGKIKVVSSCIETVPPTINFEKKEKAKDISKQKQKLVTTKPNKEKSRRVKCQQEKLHSRIKHCQTIWEEDPEIDSFSESEDPEEVFSFCFSFPSSSSSSEVDNFVQIMSSYSSDSDLDFFY